MAGTIATAYIQIEPSTKGIGSKLNSEMSTAGESGGKSYSSGFASVVGGVGKVAAGALTVGVAAAGKLLSSSVSAYGEFEQLVGGVETLFGAQGMSIEEYASSVGKTVEEVKDKYNDLQTAQEDVMANAGNAFQTAGMSANDYMETVTSFSAALISSLDGDTVKAASVADQAIVDMSDNANKMGSSMESIQNAYQGFAKQNYTMLDNLKLGYGGTKGEMERLLEDAGKISGIKYDISNLSDVYEAIHVIQTNLGITGTTAKEAATTIQGSASQMKAAWDNVVAGMGTDGADLTALIDTFVGSVETFVGNIEPVIETALTGAANLITQLAPVFAEKLPAMISAVLPQLLNSGMQVVQALTDGIMQSLPVLVPAAIDIVMQIVNFIVENLPMLIEAGMQIILQLATAIAESLPTLIPAIVEVMLTITQYLLENIDLLVDAALQLMIGLAEGLVAALPVIIEKVPIIISGLFTAIINALPKIIEAGKKIILTLSEGIESAKNTVYTKMQGVMTALASKAIEKVKEFINVGKNIVDGIKQGISNAWNDLVNWLSGMCDDLLSVVKNALGIASPSKEFAKQVGQWIPAGIAVGIENGMSVLNDTLDGMTSNMVLESVSASAEIETNLANAKYNPGNLAENNTEISSLLELMSQYLPRLADSNNVNVTLEGDAGRLFRVMQQEQRRNTQLVGV